MNIGNAALGCLRVDINTRITRQVNVPEMQANASRLARRKSQHREPSTIRRLQRRYGIWLNSREAADGPILLRVERGFRRGFRQRGASEQVTLRRVWPSCPDR